MDQKMEASMQKAALITVALFVIVSSVHGQNVTKLLTIT
jgi:hypothetical protein